jgi:DNA-binding CsgD family transcriptional regulator
MAATPESRANDSTGSPGAALRLPFEAEALERCAALSLREREILEVLATGATTECVATQLGLAPDKVRAHVDHCREVLRARSKLEAVMMALAAGVIRAPHP